MAAAAASLSGVLALGKGADDFSATLAFSVLLILGAELGDLCAVLVWLVNNGLRLARGGEIAFIAWRCCILAISLLSIEAGSNCDIGEATTIVEPLDGGGGCWVSC